MERRKTKRFSATAFLNRPINLTPVLPFIGRPIKGKLIDLSSGGLAILINQLIPQGTKLNLSLTFPDQTVLKSEVEIVHTLPREGKFLHGVQFLNLAPVWVTRIEKMSSDYINCEARINQNEPNPCTGTECAFFTMCNKLQRTNLLTNIDDGLLLEFSQLQELTTPTDH